MTKVRKAVFPAAGLGTRFLPATKAQPKEMLPLVDKPIIQYVVEEAVHSGIENIIIVTGRGKRAIEDHFDVSYELEKMLESQGKHELVAIVRDISDMIHVSYVRQKEALGLGHAILMARELVGEEPFAVLLGDDVIHAATPCLRQMLEAYESHPGSYVAIQEVPQETISSYGVIAGKPVSFEGGQNRLYLLDDVVEKPPAAEAPSNLAVIGRYILEPQIFEALAATQAGAGGEIQLTDGLRALLRERPIYGFKFEGRRYDTGDKLGFLAATVEYALRRDDLGPAFRQYLKSLSI
jgi:UTP--glucose-1-phosphate uridylyltransferase